MLSQANIQTIVITTDWIIDFATFVYAHILKTYSTRNPTEIPVVNTKEYIGIKTAENGMPIYG